MKLAVRWIGRQRGRQQRAENLLTVRRENAVRLDPHARFDRDARRWLPAVLEVCGIVMLVGFVGDGRAAVEAAQHIALEEDVCVSGRPRRPEVELHRRQVAARFVLDVGVQVASRAELVRSELVADKERHRRREIDHRSV